jgi:non-homologous end joining protein Ku
MAPRPIWSGTISFGLVSIPVRMLTATRSRELRFHYVDRHDLEPIGSLVENLSAKFDPERYDDTYRSELLELIRSKAEGAPLPEPREEEAQVVDLMQALRESVERTQKVRGSRKTS